MTSASLELGDNKGANVKVQELYQKLYPMGVSRVAEEGDVSLSRGDGLLIGDPLQPFTYDEVMLKQAYFTKGFLETLAGWHYIMDEDM